MTAMKYDPKSPLTEDQLSKLDDDSLFEYLDSKAEYNKKYSRPLDTYHAKQFLSATKGGNITDDDFKKAKKIGKVGDNVKNSELIKTENKLKKN